MFTLPRLPGRLPANAPEGHWGDGHQFRIAPGLASLTRSRQAAWLTKAPPNKAVGRNWAQGLRWAVNQFNSVTSPAGEQRTRHEAPPGSHQADDLAASPGADPVATGSGNWR